jgi:hypothetical protein
MKRFYVTFGQKSPFRNGWVLVETDSFENAIDKVLYALGGDKSYSRIYVLGEFDPALFPLGQIGETIR